MRVMPSVRLFHHRAFDAVQLVNNKGTADIAVVIPARDEAATIGDIVSSIRTELVDGAGLVDDLVVVDDGSEDSTAAVARDSGARVVSSNGTGKGAAMWTGLASSHASIVVFCDADLRQFDCRFVTGLCGPLILDPRLVLVKGRYQRPLGNVPNEGGRVTELAARPLLRLLAPDVAVLNQPLGGEVAGRREALEQVPFVEGYGVDVGLVLDIAARFGIHRIAEVELGVRAHRNRSLAELSPQAEAVLHTILDRTAARWSPRPVAERPPLKRSAGSDRFVVAGVDNVLHEPVTGLGVIGRIGRGDIGQVLTQDMDAPHVADQDL